MYECENLLSYYDNNHNIECNCKKKHQSISFYSGTLYKYIKFLNCKLVFFNNKWQNINTCLKNNNENLDDESKKEMIYQAII